MEGTTSFGKDNAVEEGTTNVEEDNAVEEGTTDVKKDNAVEDEASTCIHKYNIANTYII